MVEVIYDNSGALIGIKIESTLYSPESIALMAHQLRTAEALADVRGRIVDDVTEQNAGLLLMLERSQKWARRWKAAAKQLHEHNWLKWHKDRS